MALAIGSLFVGHVVVLFLLTLGSALLGAAMGPIWASPLLVLGTWLLFFAFLFGFKKQLVYKPMARLFLISVRDQLDDPDLPTNLDALDAKRDHTRNKTIGLALAYAADQALEHHS